MPSMYEDNQEAAAKVVQEELLEEYSRVHTSAETQRRIDNLDLVGRRGSLVDFLMLITYLGTQRAQSS